MDSSHVALVSLQLSQDGFEQYRADHNMVIGVSIGNLAKVMKLADNNDSITLSCEGDEGDPSKLKIVFENKSSQKTTEFKLNLITIDSEHLAIPDTSYSSLVTIHSQEFAKICRELSSISETVHIATAHDAVTFSVDGEVGSGLVRLHQNETYSHEHDSTTHLQVTAPVA